MRSEQMIVEKLRQLPPQQLAEVEDFVDFLVSRASKSAALDRLLAIAPALAQAGAEEISEDAVADLVREVRASRRNSTQDN
ncbi:MAG: hypothetical protein IPO35_01595 [Uliginosibacterium sp.]|jgi:hypothetical protein|nr:hypothetical protein [Uliginosibacterium sp.]